MNLAKRPPSSLRLTPDQSDILKALTGSQAKITGTKGNQRVQFIGSICWNKSLKNLEQDNPLLRLPQAKSGFVRGVFKCEQELMSTFINPILDESLAQLNIDRHESSLYHQSQSTLRLTNLVEIVSTSSSYFRDAKLYELSFTGSNGSNVPTGKCSDLYCLKFNNGLESKLGIVANLPTIIASPRRSDVFKLVVCVSSRATDETGWISEKECEYIVALSIISILSKAVLISSFHYS